MNLLAGHPEEVDTVMELINQEAATKSRRRAVDVIRDQEAMDATTAPEKLPTTEEANLFRQAALDEEAKEKQREHDNKVSLLITPKGYQKLRAFGFEVVYTGKTLPASTTDRRSL